MKGLLASRFTAWAAALAAAVVAWFVGQDFITVPDAAKATEDLTTLLSGVFAAVAAVAVWLAGVVFRKFTRGNPDDKSGGGSAGGALLVAMAGIATWGMALGGALFLTSCSPAQVEAFRAVPITIGIEGEHGTYGYSSKSGLSVAVKAPRVREEKSGINVMLILEREWECGRHAPALLVPSDRIEDFAETAREGIWGKRGSGSEAEAGSQVQVRQPAPHPF